MQERRSKTTTSPNEFRALLPAPSPPESALAIAQSSGSVRARRRTTNLNNAACQACRRRKSKCNANRPCVACSTHGTECVYETEPNETHTQALKRRLSALQTHTSAYKDVYHLLRDQPEDNANDILQYIRTGANVESIFRDHPLMLKSFRSEAGLLRDTPSEHNTAIEILPIIYTEDEDELSARHPNAYPKLDPSDARVLSESPLFQRAEFIKLSSINDVSFAPEDSSWIINSVAAAPIRPGGSGLCDADTGPLHLDTDSHYVDPRFEMLNIAFWSVVPITNEYAISAISMYLETDHPVLGLFDADLFLDHLVHCRLGYCSSFLLSSVLAFASQAYSSRNPDAFDRSYEFENEAKRLWLVETNSDSLTAIAGLALLFESVATHGQTDSKYLTSISDMAARMKLFGVENRLSVTGFDNLPQAEQRSIAYAAWGGFNFLAMNSLLDVVVVSCYPPMIPIPGKREGQYTEDNVTNIKAPTRDLMAQTFSSFCVFWTTVAEVMFIYRTSTGRERVPLSFALSKYYNLLSLADNLPSSMIRGQSNASHVLVFHIWYHAVVLDIFRPFISDEKQQDFEKWSFVSRAPEAISAASLEQLKRLILVYGAQHKCSKHSIIWHIGLMYVANAVLKDLSSDSWKFDFLFCIRAYCKLSAIFPVARGLAQGLLGMALISAAISNEEGLILREELDGRSRHKLSEDIVSGFTLDFNLAQTDPKAARVEQLIEQFNEITLFDEFITGTDTALPSSPI